MKNRTKFASTGYWASTILTATLFAVPGIALVLHNPKFAADMARMGYPLYFLPFLGIWKVLGAIVILLPGARRLKEWAYAGMMFDICGAIVSRTAVGDRGPELVLPFVIAALVALSWSLRPNDRRLTGIDGLPGPRPFSARG